MRLARIAAALAGIAFGAAACQLVAGLDGDFQQARPTDDAGPDAGAGGAGGASGCMAATYPDPPGGDDTSMDGDIVIAMRTIDLGENATVPPGYDLDHTCTCYEDAGATCVSAKPHCDAPGGIDSASAQFFGLIKLGVGDTFSSAGFSDDIASGRWSFIIRLRGYNGKLDDPKVDVAIFPSPGLKPPPVWNGKDPWTLSAQSVTAGDPEQPLYTSEGAYVAQGTLVAALPTIVMVLGSEANTLTLQLSGGVITGRLTKMGSEGWGLQQGVLAARWRIGDIFQALSSYRDKNGMPLCTNGDIAYTTVKNALCAGLDILADPNGAKSLPCDALSIGVGFTAEPAQLGAVLPPPTPTPGCPTDTDPAHDSCPP